MIKKLSFIDFVVFVITYVLDLGFHRNASLLAQVCGK